MPYGVVLKDERRTSNIERPTSNEKINTQYRRFNKLFLFLFSRFDTRNENLNVKYYLMDKVLWGLRLPGLHHGLDKLKFPILTIGPQHGCLLWYLVAVQRSL